MVELCLERTSLLYKNEWGRQQQGQQRQAQAAGVGAGGARQPARDGQGKQQGQQEGPSFGKVLAAQGPARLAEFVDYAYSLLESEWQRWRWWCCCCCWHGAAAGMVLALCDDASAVLGATKLHGRAEPAQAVPPCVHPLL